MFACRSCTLLWPFLWSVHTLKDPCISSFPSSLRFPCRNIHTATQTVTSPVSSDRRSTCTTSFRSVSTEHRVRGKSVIHKVSQVLPPVHIHEQPFYSITVRWVLINYDRVWQTSSFSWKEGVHQARRICFMGGKSHWILNKFTDIFSHDARHLLSWIHTVNVSQPTQALLFSDIINRTLKHGFDALIVIICVSTVTPHDDIHLYFPFTRRRKVFDTLTRWSHQRVKWNVSSLTKT